VKNLRRRLRKTNRSPQTHINFYAGGLTLQMRVQYPKGQLCSQRLKRSGDRNRQPLAVHPAIVELVGHSRMFDYVEFVGEYAPYDLYALENIGRAIDLFDHMSGMMKIEQEPRTYLTIRSIGSGIQNVLFADPRTVADVEACVSIPSAAAPRSPPQVRRSHAPTGERVPATPDTRWAPSFLGNI